jgi:hypothetical protein
LARKNDANNVPLILAAIGVALYVLSGFIYKGKLSGSELWLAIAIGAVIRTVLLVIAAIITATVAKISFGDLKSAILKFAGIILFAGGLTSVIPLGGLIGLFVFLGLIAWLFELEIVYAIVLTVVYALVSFGVGALLASMA